MHIHTILSQALKIFFLNVINQGFAFRPTADELWSLPELLKWDNQDKLFLKDKAAHPQL